eukprot:1187736-Prorocentrum_minimum.AAC.4
MFIWIGFIKIHLLLDIRLDSFRFDAYMFIWIHLDSTLRCSHLRAVVHQRFQVRGVKPLLYDVNSLECKLRPVPVRAAVHMIVFARNKSLVPGNLQPRGVEVCQVHAWRKRRIEFFSGKTAY